MQARSRTLLGVVGAPLAFGLLWVLPFVWLRGTIELSPRPTSTPVQHLLRNLRSFEWQWYALCFAGAWAAVPLLGWRHLPAPLRRLMWVMPLLTMLLMGLPSTLFYWIFEDHVIGFFTSPDETVTSTLTYQFVITYLKKLWIFLILVQPFTSEVGLC